VTIDVLPDNALLDIFDFYRDDRTTWIISFLPIPWRWQTLTQVCRRWRYIVLGSPRRLDLRVVCSNTTPTRTSLDIWPPFPISVINGYSRLGEGKRDLENLIAAIEHRDRIFEIHINDAEMLECVLENLVPVMQEPFPALRHFYYDAIVAAPDLPETFLGGSAPCLRSFWLSKTLFPSFPKFILSATHITDIYLDDIPRDGYILPWAMATCVAALPNLEVLFIAFEYRLPDLLQTSPPPLTRAVLPALTSLRFKGNSEYFEDFLARIDAPLLNRLGIRFLTDVDIPSPLPHNFIDRTGSLGPFNHATMKVSMSVPRIYMALRSPTLFKLNIECGRYDCPRRPSITEVFSLHLRLLPQVELLQITGDPSEDTYMNSDWLELFHLFAAVQSLYVSENLVPFVAAALQELTGGLAVEVLPALRILSLEGLQPSGPVQDGIGLFVAARQLSDCPVAIEGWDRITDAKNDISSVTEYAGLW